jgi:hypothetical protein
MAFEGVQSNFSLPAAADLSALQFTFVGVTAAGLINAAGAAANADGILQNKPKLGEAATVCFAGISKLYAGGVVAAGDAIGSDGTGRARTAAALDYIQGRALTAGAAAGAVISVLLRSGGKL